MDKQPAVYILASRRAGTLYIGVTSNLLSRLHQHRTGLIKGFTSRYGVVHLVHFELFEDMGSAITRPDWLDLAIEFGFAPVDELSVNGSPPSRG